MSSMLPKSLTAVTLLALAVLVVPLGADAQIQQEQQTPPEKPDREELTRFAHGVIDVTEIQQEMEQQLVQVEDPEEAQRIQQAANDRMVAALDERDLTPERYSEIAMLLNTDEELHEEFEEIYEQVLEERDGPRSLF